MNDPLSRRSFLTGSLVVASGLVSATALGCRPAGQRHAPGTAVASDASRLVLPAPCAPGVATEDNIEGPYYRSGAPFRSDLSAAGIVGLPLVVTGNVLSMDCRSPIADAVLDVWQADGNGHYDNDGTFPRDTVRLRGKVRASSTGAFSFRSVLPGRYLNGRTYRPAHVHVKVSAAGHAPLTTQLYFPDDPYNAADPFIRTSLIMDVSRTGSSADGHFDFVLTPLRRR